MDTTLTGLARAALLALGTALAVARPADSVAASPAGLAPDVRVTYVAKASDTSRVTYMFLVSNVGDTVADPVRLAHATTQQGSGRQADAPQESSRGATIVSLGPRQSMTLAVVCDPEPGFRCIGAELRAALPDDTEPRDNVDVSR